MGYPYSRFEFLGPAGLVWAWRSIHDGTFNVTDAPVLFDLPPLEMQAIPTGTARVALLR